MSTALQRGEHGRPHTWRQGCRCDACRNALRAESKVRWATMRLRQGREPQSWQPARPVRRRITELAAAGWSRGRIARTAGVGTATVSEIANRHRAHVRCGVARAVLAVQP